MNYIVIPSIIARSQKELEDLIKKVSKLNPELIQLDVMDGSFVPRTSLEFDLNLPKHSYEAHLMMQNPEPWFLKHHAQTKSVVIHYESQTHIHEIIRLIKTAKRQVGIAINPETPAEDISQYLSLIDKVLVMTVHPGKYGSHFIPESLEKIRQLRQLAPKLDIEVDGGITPETLKRCKEAGANQFVVGSFLQKAKNFKEAWDELNKS